jgi:hypothetical protein
MPTEEYRSAYLENAEFEPMPSPVEQRWRELERQLKLQQEVERKLANRAQLAVSHDKERRGVGRDKLFAAFRQFIKEQK